MLRRLCIALLAVAAFPAAAHAGEPSYRFDGGTPAQQTTVRAALAASSFPWDVLRGRGIVVHIREQLVSSAASGEVWLDAKLLDTPGRFSWGVVQHEFAHQVDFLLLDDTRRAALARALGGSAWFGDGGGVLQAPNGTLEHGELAAERFASTLAWAFWPRRANVLRPESPADESAAMRPRPFRNLVLRILGLGPQTMTRRS